MASASRGIMIDRDGSPDRDDAIWAEAEDDGWKLTVHVACAADAVRPGSPADQRAARMVQTKYLPDKTIRMLPDRPGQAAALASDGDRPALKITWHVARDGSIGGAELSEGTLRRPVAMNYEAATAAISDEKHPQHQVMATAHAAATALLARRRNDGALAIYNLIAGWASDGDGGLRQLAAAERHASYMIVAEFMVAANTLAAGFCVDRDIPAIFRTHKAAGAAPPPEQLMEDLQLAAGGGREWHREVASQRLDHLLRPAEYSARAEGHFGLRLPWYSTVTSPLRRYPDLVVQRQLLAVLRGQQPPHTAGDLEQIAASVNDIIRKRRETRSEQNKERTRQKRRAELAAGGYRDLPGEQFCRLVRIAVKEQRHTQGLEEELARRAEEDSLLPRDAYPVLTAAGPEWEPSRAALVSWLSRHPEHAVTLVSMHAVNLGMTAPLWEEEFAGTAHEPLFSARAGIAADGPVTWSEARTARRKDSAQQQAALSLLAGLAGQPDPSVSAPVPAAAGPAVALPAASAEGRTPAMALNEMSQTGILTSLEWAYSESGPPHQREFTCTATARTAPGTDPLTAHGTARSKKDAKTAAAARLYETVTSRLQTPGAASAAGTSAQAGSPESLPAAVPAASADGLNPAMALNEMSQTGTLTSLEWAYSESGPPHQREFTCTATARTAPGTDPLTAHGTARSKKDAKTAAAARLYRTVVSVPAAG